jgi:hypothetical protein
MLSSDVQKLGEIDDAVKHEEIGWAVILLMWVTAPLVLCSRKPNPPKKRRSLERRYWRGEMYLLYSHQGGRFCAFEGEHILEDFDSRVIWWSTRCSLCREPAQPCSDYAGRTSAGRIYVMSLMWYRLWLEVFLSGFGNARSCRKKFC